MPMRKAAGGIRGLAARAIAGEAGKSSAAPSKSGAGVGIRRALDKANPRAQPALQKVAARKAGPTPNSVKVSRVSGPARSAARSAARAAPLAKGPAKAASRGSARAGGGIRSAAAGLMKKRDRDKA